MVRNARVEANSEKPPKVAATRRRLGRLLAPFGYRTGEPEVGEHAGVGKKVISAILLPARVSTSRP